MAYDKRNYERQKLAKQYYLARWDHFFETGELLPVDWWKQVWKRRLKAADGNASGKCDTTPTKL